MTLYVLLFFIIISRLGPQGKTWSTLFLSIYQSISIAILSIRSTITWFDKWWFYLLWFVTVICLIVKFDYYVVCILKAQINFINVVKRISVGRKIDSEFYTHVKWKYWNMQRSQFASRYNIKYSVGPLF